MPTEPKLFTIEFDAVVQPSSPRLTIPVEVRRAFGWHDKSAVGLLIFDMAGQCKFCGVHVMKSGPEIYGLEMTGILEPGEHIHVVAFPPPTL